MEAYHDQGQVRLPKCVTSQFSLIPINKAKVAAK